MARRVFFSFHFDNDFWRTQQVRNMNALDGNRVYTANAWEEVKRKGKTAIEDWIDENMSGKSCVVVLVGSQTAERPWVLREIEKGWKAGKGVLGIRINRLLGSDGRSCIAGTNPFTQLGCAAPLKMPTGADSKEVYASIRDNIETWIEDAISIRNKS